MKTKGILISIAIISILLTIFGIISWWACVLILIGVAFIPFTVVLFIPIIMYSVASGLSHLKKVQEEAWDYWEKMKHNRWEDLSEDEQKKLVHACMIIAEDVGAVTTEEEQKQYLKDQLPIYEPHVGLSYKI